MKLLKHNWNDHNIFFDDLIKLLLFYGLMECVEMNYKIILLCITKKKYVQIGAQHLYRIKWINPICCVYCIHLILSLKYQNGFSTFRCISEYAWRTGGFLFIRLNYRYGKKFHWNELVVRVTSCWQFSLKMYSDNYKN